MFLKADRIETFLSLPKRLPLCSFRIAPKQFKGTFWLCSLQKQQFGELQRGRSLNFGKNRGMYPLCRPVPTPFTKFDFDKNCLVLLDGVGWYWDGLATMSHKITFAQEQ